MRFLFVCGAMISALSLPAFAQPQTATNSYDVFRNGKNIGTHIVTFEKDGETLRAETQTKMKVKLLFVTAFSYDYVSTEYWQDGELMRVDSLTKNKNDNIVTQAKRADDVFHVSREAKGKTRTSTAAAPIAPTSHWNMAGLKQKFSFDTITTENTPVSVSFSAQPNQENFSGQRYDVEGAYKYTTYYDAAGHWLGMAFDRNGFIEFRCNDCQNTLWPDPVSEETKAQLSSYP